jgi:isopentenyl-diphosphate Delta-isomerase
MQEQLMILVNEQDEQIGTMPKMAAHEQGVLHRAFSIFLFDDAGNMILQQRALSKYHSAGLWTNACCSHPSPNETVEQAALRRMQEELGIQTDLQKAFTFLYNAPMENGLTEHELDHVFIGTCHQAIQFNTQEVAAIKSMPMMDLQQSINTNPELYTAWFKIALPQLTQWLNQQS